MREKSKGIPGWKICVMSFFAAVVIVAGIYLIGTGFMRITSAYVGEFTVSADGTSMEIKTGVGSSMGYIRDVAVKRKGEDIYLTFYAAFGGLNSSLGAKNTFDIPLSADSSRIHIYRGDGYQLILQKNAETGEWQQTDDNQN